MDNNFNNNAPYQNNYQQSPYYQAPPQQPVTSGDNSQLSLILCIASLLCCIFAHIMFFCDFNSAGLIDTFFRTFIKPFAGFLLPISYALVAVAIVKDKKSIFAKVLLILYAIELVLGTIVCILAIAGFIYLLKLIAG